MSNIYSESEFSELPAIQQLENLGYNYLNWEQETFSNWISNFWRFSQSDVILKPKLEQAFQRLNPNLKPEHIQKAIKKLQELTQLALNDSQDLFNLNYQFYQAVKDGITIKVDKKDKKVKFIDFQNPQNNDFTIINQLTIKWKFGYEKRPDLIIFVNGLPFVIFEFKAPDIDIIQAYEKNIQDYKYSIPQLFVSNAFAVLSNWVSAKAWSTFAGYDFYKNYNKINQEDEDLPANQDNLIKVLFPKERFLDILENFILYNPEDKKKILAQNHQIIWVNKAFEKVKTWEKRLWVFWHTQWSWKSFSMLFFSSKVKRKIPWNWTFLVVTDRTELDKQIYTTFTKYQINQEKNVHAESIAHLKELLTENHSFIFTLIHKFQDIKSAINKRDDIIVLVDEGHRSQYWELAMNMHLALPNARFLAFTWTPLLEWDKITKDVFGDYVSIYNFSAAIKDNATVEIYYENRKPKLKLSNPDLDEQIKEVFDKYEVDDESAEKISKKFWWLYKVLTSPQRLQKIAKDIVYDYFFKGDDFKAMVVTIDKPTAYRMYFYIKDEIEQLKQNLENKLKNWTISDREKLALEKIKNFDFAVMVSLTNTQWELEKVEKYWLDIRPIIERIQKEDLEKEFKDPDSKLKMIIVVSMWLTGFDAPSIRTLYLDKPMKNHTLMQTIARTNRVAPWKENWIIIDYVWIFWNLKKALENYAWTKWDYPAKDKKALFEKLNQELAEYKTLFKEFTQEDFDQIQDLRTDLVKILAKLDEKEKLKLKIISNKVLSTYKSLLPNDGLAQYVDDIKKIKILLNLISQTKAIDISALKNEIDRLIEESISSDSFLIKDYHLSKNLLDLTNEKFEKDFEQVVDETWKLWADEQKVQIKSLWDYLKQRLEQLWKKSDKAVKFREKLQKIIDEYNTNWDLEKLLEDFKTLHKEISEKEKEILETNLSDEEYKLFEKLSEDFKISNKKKLKELAKQLYEKIKEILDVYWSSWKEQENIRSKIKVDLWKTMLSFCQQSEDERCKQFLKYAVSDVFQYVLKKW
jgi:type I restriction enzyme R subunit